MTSHFLLALLSFVLLSVPARAQQSPQAYAGQERRTIKALSEEEVKALLNGEGMGLAKAAELNHYPGPRHVLQLADKLNLSESQRLAVEAAFSQMQTLARALGARIVREEEKLDRLFAEGSVSAQNLDAALKQIGGLQSQLRSAHLEAHIKTRAVLTPEQIVKYDKLRGYSDLNSDVGHH